MTTAVARRAKPPAKQAAARFSLVANSPTPVVTAARRLNRAAGTIATSVLIDSAMEHWRGKFHNPAMWTPLVTASASLAVSVHGLSDRSMALSSGATSYMGRRGWWARSAPVFASTTSASGSAVSRGRTCSTRRRSARRRRWRYRG